MMSRQSVTAFFAILLLAQAISASTYYCDSCEDCTRALNTDEFETVYLADDIRFHADEDILSDIVSCISTERYRDIGQKTLDCEGHMIIGASDREYIFENELIPYDAGIRIHTGEITVRNCTVTNFTYAAFIYGTGHEVSDNVFRDNIYGVSSYASGSVFSRNTASGHWHEGFYFEDAGANMITGNIALDNLQGFELLDCENNTLRENVANGNGVGFYIFGGSSNSLSNNSAIGNSVNGLDLYRTSGNFITNNTLCGNGLDIEMDGAADNDGYGNACGSAGQWSDHGTIGCAHDCLDTGAFREFTPARCAAVGEFIIMTSLGRLCGDQECAFRSGLGELSDSLSRECYDVSIIDIDGIAEIPDEIRSRISGIGDAYLFIIGDYGIVPACTYDDEVEGGSFFSDDCYGAGEGPSDIIISRLPVYEGLEQSAIDYLGGMADYHREKAGGVSGLNDERLENEYHRNCPVSGMRWYYLISSPDHAVQQDENPATEWHRATDEDVSGPDANAYPIQYYMLHGSSPNRRWTAVDDVVAVEAGDIRSYPFAAFSFSCYGGNVQSHLSIPPVWLFGRYDDVGGMPNAFMGSNDISYFGNYRGVPIGSDILIDAFHMSFENGETVGKSFLNAKKMAYGYEYNDAFGIGANFLSALLLDDKVAKANRKVAIEYQLFGDPLLTGHDLINAKNDECTKLIG